MEITELNKLALNTLETKRVAIFIVAYNAEKQIQDVILRIPSWVAEKLEEIYLFDDHSSDRTVEVAREVSWSYCPLKIFSTPDKQGYGGNQKLGFKYAIDRAFDLVVLLHGDGKYAPESLPAILAPFSQGEEVVFGSRFLSGQKPLLEGMPFYKWLGNQFLTFIQNCFLGTRLAEMHCGYRAYSVKALNAIPFLFNSSDFSFDAEIIIQLLNRGFVIKEVPIPTYYAKEIYHVNGTYYAFQCVERCLRYLCVKSELLYDSRFSKSEVNYFVKNAKTSVHHFVRELQFPVGSKLVDVGGGNGEAISKAYQGRGLKVTCIDLAVGEQDSEYSKQAVDLNLPWSQQFQTDQYDNAIALDILEHLVSPEMTASEIYKHLKVNGELYASTGNIAYLPIRILLLFGIFNYSNRGILDRTHRRLFTVGSFRQLFEDAGFNVEKIIGFGPPISDLWKEENVFIKTLDEISYRLAQFWPSLFAYQVVAICKKRESKAEVLNAMLTEAKDHLES